MNLKSSIAVVGLCLACGLFIYLGLWQLERANEKRELIRLRSDREAGLPIQLDGDAEDLERLEYRKVIATGVYDSEHQFLLDNQVVSGRAGVHVMTPLRIRGMRQAVLVNRGWIPLTVDRRIDTDISVDSSVVEILGKVNHFLGVGYRIDGAEIPTPGWPSLVQVVDVEAISDVLGYPIHRYQILLAKDKGPGFDRDWPEVYPMSPEKHTAYAIQWFALALTLVAVVWWRNIK